MNKKKIVIAGGSGFIGTVLIKDLVSKGYDIVALSRSDRDRKDGARWVKWDGRSQGDWKSELSGALAIINLSGTTLQKKFTEEYKKKILHSRTDTVDALTSAVKSLNDPPEVFIQASGVNLYETDNSVKTESSPPGNDFLAEVVQKWEAALNDSGMSDTRKVILRFGIILGNEGGGFPILRTLTKYFLGSSLGSGDQGTSWMHIDDVVKVVNRALDDKEMEGPFNMCTPNPVSNREFMRVLRKVMNRPWAPPVPAFIVKFIAALDLGLNGTIALNGVYCQPEKLKKLNYSFEFENLEDALKDLTQ